MDDDKSKQPEEETDGQTNWQFKPEGGAPTDDEAQTEAAPVDSAQEEVAPLAPQEPDMTWTATEFIVHEKSPLWYAALVLIAAALAALVLLVTHDKVSTAIIVIVAIIFGASAGRKPRDLKYALSSKGVTVNRSFRPYSDFKAFAVLQENGTTSITFLPIKRLTLPLSIYLGNSDEDDVVNKLSDYLPLDQTHDHDAVDRFVQRIHF